MKNNQLQHIDGILLLDKPIGISSNQALQRVKRLFRAKKAGHAGTLDVLASGMLVICFGKATKMSKYLLGADKYYRFTAKLGEKTTTADSEGEVLETRSTEHVTQELIESILAKFRGEISQIPSMYSALKYKGQPLYKLARQGITIERKPRQVVIHELKLLAWSKTQLSLDVRCSKGTYVRNLAEDIGEALGCGAHVIALRRLAVGNFTAAQMVTIEKLQELRDVDAIRIHDYLVKIEAMHNMN
jgi:tRNA pseudouridine55 synthase